MRFTAILPLLCILASLVLSLLCLFAGSRQGFLEEVDLLTLNTSRIGHTPLFNTSDGDGGFFSSVFNDIQGDINDAAADVASDVARAIGIHHFYKQYILRYCKGYYKHNTTDENITQCSSRVAFATFNPTEAIEAELKPGLNLSVIRWPDQIDDSFQAVKMSMRAMFVLYCIGIALTAIAVLGALFSFLLGGILSAILNFMICILAFIALGIASALVTVAIVKVTNSVNKYGKPIGIAAYKGGHFLGMTWAATGLILLAAFLWIMDCLSGRRRRTTVVREK